MMKKCRNLKNEIKTRWGDSINLLYCSHIINKSRRSHDNETSKIFGKNLLRVAGGIVWHGLIIIFQLQVSNEVVSKHWSISKKRKYFREMPRRFICRTVMGGDGCRSIPSLISYNWQCNAS